MAWALLRYLDSAADQDLAAADLDALLRQVLDPRRRYRAKEVLSVPRDGAGWARLLAPRGRKQRCWIHSGVVDDFLRDPRVHPGRARAAAAHGLAISAAGDLCVYVAVRDVADLISRFQIEPDEQGDLLMYVVPEPAVSYLPGPGEPVSAAAAAADMLDSPDARMQYAGEQWIARHSLQIPIQR
jgi:hypothetical protein